MIKAAQVATKTAAPAARRNITETVPEPAGQKQLSPEALAGIKNMNTALKNMREKQLAGIHKLNAALQKMSEKSDSL